MNYPWTHGISAMKKMDCLVQYTSKNIKRKISLAETVFRCDHTWRGRKAAQALTGRNPRSPCPPGGQACFPCPQRSTVSNSNPPFPKN